MSTDACTAGDCDRPVYADGRCEPHYRRAKRGSTSAAPVKTRGTEPLRSLSLRVPARVHRALGKRPGARAREVLERWAGRQ